MSQIKTTVESALVASRKDELTAYSNRPSISGVRQNMEFCSQHLLSAARKYDDSQDMRMTQCLNSSIIQF